GVQTCALPISSARCPSRTRRRWSASARCSRSRWTTPHSHSSSVSPSHVPFTPRATAAGYAERTMDLTGGLQIARIRGIAIQVHWSWLLIFTLVTWSLSVTYQDWFEGWNQGQAYAAAAASQGAFFLSVLLHVL